MKKMIFAILVSILSLPAFAIEFITEEQVQAQLGAEKVIEVSTYSVESLLQEKADCLNMIYSKSARAYVVKKEGQSFLYVTESGLDTLTQCVEF